MTHDTKTKPGAPRCPECGAVYDEDAPGGPCANPDCIFPATRAENQGQPSATWANGCLALGLAPFVLVVGTFVGGAVGGYGGAVAGCTLGALFCVGVANGGLET